ncbi:MAG TPA: formylmethanofuran--tetrahydromethanopterin N-formyltransferase [Lacipirellulaceae bacterium]|jgi:formylmethanofuran--tetrahydromethanopterin N-formyltransferase|nr:formylmethanofuran--tetrahydromethanopterin N-formyltransferase [Lacipirellulaceae bacterium]
MRIGYVEIQDTFAEAFGARFTRLIITAADDYWLGAALQTITGYGTSVLGCDAEAGVERYLGADESPDGRPAAAVLLFALSAEAVGLAAKHRVGQCILTCPTTACFNGLTDAAETYSLGKYLRYFGDGHESQKTRSKGKDAAGSGARSSLLAPRALWYIPVMDGEFCVEATAGIAKGVAGGNFILFAKSQSAGLAAGRRAAAAIAPLKGVILPFPGGVCRSGSKVGSKYKALIASTADAYCPTLRNQVPTELVPGAECAYEIVIDGIDQPSVAAAMRAGIEAAAGDGLLAIGGGNYGGKLGKYPIRLHELFDKARESRR